MVDPTSSGRITREDLFRIVNGMYRVLTNMRIPVYEADIHSYVNDLWQRFDTAGKGLVTREIFVAQAQKHQNLIIGLGVVSIPTDPPKLPKRGVSVSFGHFYWSLALQMMVGMRLAVRLLSAWPSSIILTPHLHRLISNALETRRPSNLSILPRSSSLSFLRMTSPRSMSSQTTLLSFLSAYERCLALMRRATCSASVRNNSLET